VFVVGQTELVQDCCTYLGTTNWDARAKWAIPRLTTTSGIPGKDAFDSIGDFITNKQRKMKYCGRLTMFNAPLIVPHVAMLNSSH